jgi:hypothetical protein
MGPDAANLAGSIAKSLEVERSAKATQRASEIEQDADADAFASALKPIKADGTDALRRARLLQERERRRKEIERRGPPAKPKPRDDSDDEHELDVMV